MQKGYLGVVTRPKKGFKVDQQQWRIISTELGTTKGERDRQGLFNQLRCFPASSTLYLAKSETYEREIPSSLNGNRGVPLQILSDPCPRGFAPCSG